MTVSQSNTRSREGDAEFSVEFCVAKRMKARGLVYQTHPIESASLSWKWVMTQSQGWLGPDGLGMSSVEIVSGDSDESSSGESKAGDSKLPGRLLAAAADL